METALSILLILAIFVGCVFYYYLMFVAFNIVDGYKAGKRGSAYYNNNALYLAIWYHVGYKWGWARYLRSNQEWKPQSERNIERFNMEEYR